jgi:hypothetical protein
VNYSKLPFLMLEAIRELKTLNDHLKSENDDLRSKLQSAEDRYRAQGAQMEERLRHLEAALSIGTNE